MTILVGYGAEGRGRESLELGRLLATSSGEPLVVCCAVSDRWEVPTPDTEYAAYLRSVAQEALADAAEVLGDTPAEYVVRTGRSLPGTLLTEARAREATALVVGSAQQASWGHVALGSVSDRLMHSSDVPLALAPRGFRSPAGAVVTRATIALDGTAAHTEVLLTAAQVATGVGARVRVVTFAVRGRTMYPPELGLRTEDDVLAAWREQASTAQQSSVERLRRETTVEPDDVLVAEGRSWSEAVDGVGWDDGDVLVIGSSTQGPVSRVFLGSTAARIVRHAPVPVIVVPRSR